MSDKNSKYDTVLTPTGKQIAGSNTAILVADFGNALIKALRHGDRASTVVFPHSVEFRSQAQFQTTVEQLAARPGSYTHMRHDTFKSQYHHKTLDDSGKVTSEKREEYVLVGESAESSNGSRVFGELKYRPSVIGAFLRSCLLRLYPDGHDNVIVAALYPPGDARHLEQIKQSLIGKHVITTIDGQKIKYNVRGVLLEGEPMGGRANLIYSADGSKIRKSGLHGNGLFIDIGGEISNFAPMNRNGTVDFNALRSIKMGVIDIMERMGELIINNPQYRKHFRSVVGNRLPMDYRLRAALSCGQYLHSGYEFDVLSERAEASERFIQDVREIYAKYYGSGNPYAYIAISGGGGAATYQLLIERVLGFNAENIYTTHDDLDKMHLANVFGLDVIVAMLIAEGQIDIV